MSPREGANAFAFEQENLRVGPGNLRLRTPDNEKRPPLGWAFLIGGDDGNRTRVISLED